MSGGGQLGVGGTMSTTKSSVTHWAWLAFAMAGALGVSADAAFRAAKWGLGAGLGALAVIALTFAARRVTGAEYAASRGNAGWDQVRLEIDRARRYDSPVTLARFPLAGSSARTRWSVADRAERVLRGSDAAWLEARSLFMLMPGEDAESAQVALDRVAEALDVDLTGAPVVASFPSDVLTLGALIDALHPPHRARSAAPVHITTQQPRPVTSGLTLEAEQASAS